MNRRYRLPAQAKSFNPGNHRCSSCVLIMALLTTPPVALAEPAAYEEPSASSVIILAQAESQIEARAMVNLMNQLDGLSRDLNTSSSSDSR